jgi:hypothetical protein
LLPRVIDSLDVIEMTMLLEEVFEVEVPDSGAENFDGLRAIVDCLEILLSNKRPNKRVAAMLKGLAKKHQWPELAEGLEGTWRREQIAAIVRELLRNDR